MPDIYPVPGAGEEDRATPPARLSSAGRPLRIAMLCHSTHPRGGVAHALALAEALVDRGHEVAVHAPDPSGGGFPRAARCALVSVAAAPAPAGGLAELVSQRVEEYAAHFRAEPPGRWDIWHAHDGIGANALLQLRREQRLPGFVRTVHHLDAFTDMRLIEWQTNSVLEAEAVGCVSAHWVSLLGAGFGIDAPLIGNGVDLQRFSARPLPNEAPIRRLYQIDEEHRPLILSVGGVEERKNPIRLLQAFLRLRKAHPKARLLIVGGASLLDHGHTQLAFQQLLKEHRLHGKAGEDVVRCTGPLPDEHIPVLMRAADVLAFPSLLEGFGLVTLEAMACGLPVVTSRIPPFTDYLNDAHCRFANPMRVSSIASALEEALDPWVRASLRPSAFALTRKLGWQHCAARQEALYRSVLAKRPLQPSPHADAPLPLP